MPSIERPGTATVYAEVPADLKKAFADYAAQVGSDLREQIVLAMRRHLAFPPKPAELPPLPDAKPARKRKE